METHITQKPVPDFEGELDGEPDLLDAPAAERFIETAEKLLDAIDVAAGFPPESLNPAKAAA